MGTPNALAAVGTVAVGVVCAGIGYVLATDYRGFTAWHTRTSIRFAHPLTRIPPWRWLPPRLKDPEEAFVRQYRFMRLGGWPFVLVGAVAVVGGVVQLVRTAA